VVLGFKEDRTREVLAISHKPEESATDWRMLLENLLERSVNSIEFNVADGLTGLESNDITIATFRADTASYQEEAFEVVEANTD